MKTFVVTGGLGFIGSHFVETVLDRDPNNQVICIDSMTYASNPHLVQEFEERFGGRFTQVTDDISEIEDVPSCDYLVNFAAETHVDNSINSSDTFLKTNIQGVHNLLEILRRKKIRHMQRAWEFKSPVFVYISTDEVLGDLETGFAKEGRVHKPSNPYAASKSCAEQLMVAWGRTYQIPYVITRTTNNYGPRQHPEKLIPRAVTSIRDDLLVPIHAGGTPRRNWIHVRDNVEGILTVLEKGKRNTSYHIASDEEVSVKEIVEMIAGRFGKTFEEVSDFSSERSGVDMRYALDTTKIKRLGWKPTRNLSGSLKEIIESLQGTRSI